jgi:putative intracellular protease/amidase
MVVSFVGRQPEVAHATLSGSARLITGIPVYDKVDMPDVTGPYEMFDWAGYEIDLLAERKGIKQFRSKGSCFDVTKSFADARP